MKTVEEWFELYGESHQNRTNKLIHYVCVPAILYAVLALLDGVSKPYYFDFPFSMALPLLFAGGCFYLMLNWRLGMVTLLLCFAMVATFHFYTHPKIQIMINLALFVVAWIFQFIGHKIEGKKPSFLQDILFLMIGPLWIVDHWTGQTLRDPQSIENQS